MTIDTPAYPPSGFTATVGLFRRHAAAGFTLLEILTVVSIMSLSVFLMAPEFIEQSEEERIELTLLSMQEIKKAILGTASPRLEANFGLSGYLPDMGALPALVDGQPVGLWRTDLNNDGTYHLPSYHDYYASYHTGKSASGTDGQEIGGAGYGISLGWRGPYLGRPDGDILKDAWANAFVFSKQGQDFVIRSYGADGKAGGSNSARDLVVTIRSNDTLAAVAGYISPNVVYKHEADAAAVGIIFTGGVPPVKVRIYYRPNPFYDAPHLLEKWKIAQGGLLFKEVDADDDGFFCFNGNKRIPVGSARMLMVTQAGIRDNYADLEIRHPYKLTVRPGINWLGRMGSVP